MKTLDRASRATGAMGEDSIADIRTGSFRVVEA
jgi:hypothetical protein